jgi:hypothetical protein
MGYRSEVGLCLTKDAAAKLDEARAYMKVVRDERLGDTDRLFMSAEERHDEDGSIAYYWSSLKWYADYEDVAFVDKFLKSIDGSDYLFLRVGEDVDDTESRGWWWDNPFEMRVSREIMFNDV